MIERPISILFVVPSWKTGGAERITAMIAESIDPRRFESSMAVFSLGSIQPNDPTLTMYDLENPRLRSALWPLLRLARRIKPDIIFASNSYINVAIGLMRPFLPTNTKLVFRQDSLRSALSASERGFARWWTKFYNLAYRRADAIVCQTDLMRRDLLAGCEIPGERVVRIYNPVSRPQRYETKSPFRSSAINILAVGRLAHTKGFDELIRAMVAVRKVHSRAHLTITGDGSMLEDLQRLRESSGLRDAVTFAGFVTELAPYYQHSDLFVLSSTFEGLPNALLEAAAYGLPIVSTPCQGTIREILPSSSALWLTEDNSPDALSRAMITALASPRTSEGDPHGISRFDFATTLNAFEQLFESVHCGHTATLATAGAER